MTSESPKIVLAVLDDLFFQVKIADAGKRAGLQLTLVKTEEALMQKLQDNPVVVLLDLNCRSVDPIQLISALKAGPHSDVPVIAYVSHVQSALIQQAQQAGCDAVMARSAFSANLPQILLRYA